MPLRPRLAARAARRRRPAHARARYRSPSQLPDGRRAGRRRVGVRRPARRRDPRLGPAGDARGRAATRACRASIAARDILWWLDAHRASSTRRPTTCSTSRLPRQPAVAAARRAGPTARRSTCRCCERARRAARRPAARRRGRTACVFADDLRGAHARPPTRGSRGCSSGSTSSPLAAGCDAGVGPREPFRPFHLAGAGRRPRSTCGAAASARRLGDRLSPRYPWLQRSRARRARRDPPRGRRHGGCPASTCSACCFLRRRKSSFIDGVGRDAIA